MNAVPSVALPAAKAAGTFGNSAPPHRIDQAGVYDLSHEAYHADPCDVPSLSSSVAKILVRQTAAHAWQAHARFGNEGMAPTRVMDDGSIVHAMMLGQSDLIEPIRAVHGLKTKRRELIGRPVADYKSDAAQEERDEIRGVGRIPVLHHRLTRADPLQDGGDAPDRALG